ncbi:ACP S-malonyltransferase [Actinoalloteichus hymeniacidonis]|uniref:Malonyl CoA-acyl carrier protein transacylase n=1 Tax=Actinoalloteichus hymeniacidonis TaxID=340345 RepID=A0AAC9HMP1_9PSEU|nr:ACP S-malonyltransferase [Actinoalloteichus hymeniacidonis]AOS61968.1 (acyl-carrier-protein) S-malonyltransferase [Actinoalloteichus hymeniacidonis]MBB5910010.1 [acyl-carrier-protein] S-malonyltransferase [Actinoalloteichus hymeniacidonis]
MLAFLFPGQGTLRVGMGARLRARKVAAEVFAQADELLPTPISTLCSSGPTSALIATENAQPAVTVCNLAALAVLAEEGHQPDLVAGHSVGEISALHAAGVLDLAGTLRLVSTRARLMAECGGLGGMIAVRGLAVEKVSALVAEASTAEEPLVVGLENARDNVVVSGAKAAIERFTEAVGSAGQVRKVEVSDAFHSPLMQPAAQRWAEAVRAEPMSPPRIPVIPNVTAEPTTDLDVVRDALIAQLTQRVRWAETMDRIEGASCVEVGDSKTLTALLRGTPTKCVSMVDPSVARKIVRDGAA